MRLIRVGCLYLILCSYTLAKSPVLLETQERFHPVTGLSGMVVTQEAVATRIGHRILANGGNAVDAATAIGFALAVTLPRAGNLAGGGFMLIWRADKQQAVAINYRETAPQQAKRELFLNDQGQVDRQRLTQSYQACGVPGTVAGLLLAHSRYGRLPLERLLQPAIQLARDGIIVTPDLAASLQHMRDYLQVDPVTQAIFFKANGQPYGIGERLRQPELANTLRLIAKQGKRAFYQGTIAKQLVAAMQRHHGLIQLADLKAYRARLLKPVIGHYHGYQILSMPLPSSGGITLILLLNILEDLPLLDYGLNSAQYIHVLSEALNRAFNDRNTLLGDPHFVHVPIRRLLSKHYAARLRNTINFSQHTPAKAISRLAHQLIESEETTHFSVMDRSGNIVVNTTTLNFSYGSGHVVPGTGMFLNNEMADFTAKVGVADPFGLVEGEKNAIAPGKQPLSSMTPTIVLTPDGQPILATGSPGGSRIISIVLQIILNTLTHHLNIATATAMPRIHSQLWPDTLFVEQGISPDSLALLRQMGHRIVSSRAMGAGQSIMRQGKRLFGASDTRRSGSLALANY